MSRLVIHFHRDMRASIEVGIDLSLETDRETPANLPVILHVKPNGQGRIHQVG